MAGFEGLDPSFAQRLLAMINASGGRVSIFSGYRSVETQTELWNEAVAKYGSEDAARQWVAPPGKSNHNHGIAADLAFNDDDSRQWVHDNAARFGLTFPMSWEPWHIEPAEARGQADPAAYTIPTEGEKMVDDPSNRYDIGYQLQSFMGVLHTMGRPGSGVGSGQRTDPVKPQTQSTSTNALPGVAAALREIAPNPGTEA